MGNEVIAAPMTTEEQIQQLKSKCFLLEAALGLYKGELKACANELCYKCGSYKYEHEGACSDCRFRKARHGDWSELDPDWSTL